MTIDTWEEGCEDAAATIYLRIAHSNIDYRYSPTEAIKVLRSELDPVNIEALDWGSLDYAAMGAVATYCGGKVNGDESSLACLDRIGKLLAAKQHDYGHGNILRFGLLGIVVRISDKLARLENLYAREETLGQGPQVSEPIADTWDDIVGYCTIALMVLDDTFRLDLEADQEVPDDVTVDESITSLPGGAMYCITEHLDTYWRRADGTWVYLGQGKDVINRTINPPAVLHIKPEPVWAQGLDGSQGRPEWGANVGMNTANNGDTPYEYGGPTPVTFSTLYARKS